MLIRRRPVRDHRAQPGALGIAAGARVLYVAGLWLQLQAEFLAIALVLVYVGAVMVLFLFVVMMLDINLAKLREGFWNYLPRWPPLLPWCDGDRNYAAA